ncbi:hypothetical protein GP486_002463 [Trichoglossum hirsutum]|uniref:Uncharacterized protein n=1 Tax=Trichoglossum hirsutum TaxID=265104 RepID=A0A9P8RRP9_9PEZI|nr:hypothetical protein GP486_002463 [Trichoglossum hirsutum]
MPEASMQNTLPKGAATESQATPRQPLGLEMIPDTWPAGAIPKLQIAVPLPSYPSMPFPKPSPNLQSEGTTTASRPVRPQRVLSRKRRIAKRQQEEATLLRSLDLTAITDSVAPINLRVFFRSRDDDIATQMLEKEWRFDDPIFTENGFSPIIGDCSKTVYVADRHTAAVQFVVEITLFRTWIDPPATYINPCFPS